ncbi:MAG: ATP-binding protein [Oscillospiraceae bacterium]|nr:ATP-binding protein [Oscillospiraceae bacterium]
MAYSEQILQRARARLEEARRERERENDQQRQLAYERYPKLLEIERKLRLTMTKLIATSLRYGEDPKEAVAAIREENLALQREREWILDSEELDYESPICGSCGGTGYIGSTMCTCLRELCRQEQKKELTSLLGSGRESFESFRLDYYPDIPDSVLGVSPRRLMQSNFKICRRYAQNFGPGAGNLLFVGPTGLGKTFLSACIARQVADRGYSVVYETAIRVFTDFETEKFSMRQEENRGLSRKYLECDLLIIDDLGTEMTTPFTVSALYHIVNTRMMENLSTIISTNLSDNVLDQRYSPQIASRITAGYRVIKFAGDDIRHLKKGGTL